MGFSLSLALAVGVPEVLGSLVGASTKDSLLGWFKNLRKPSWEPPGPLFGIAWSILYAVMGVASWRVWVQGGWQANQYALSLYVVQLALNLAWPLVFFNAKKLGAALVLNLGVFVTAAATASAFYKVDHLAGQLMLPYLAWLAFANALNYSVLQKNPQESGGQQQSPNVPAPRGAGYGSSPPPTTAYLNSTHAFASNAHSRRSTVQVQCSQVPSSSGGKVGPVMKAAKAPAGMKPRAAMRPMSTMRVHVAGPAAHASSLHGRVFVA